MFGCSTEQNPDPPDPDPTFSAIDLSRALGFSLLFLEFPEELQGQTLRYEITWESGRITWGGGLRVPEDRLVKVLIDPRGREIKYLQDWQDGYRLSGTQLLDEDEYPYFSFSPAGRFNEMISYDEYRLVFARTRAGLDEALFPPLLEDRDADSSFVVWRLIPHQEVPESFRGTPLTEPDDALN